MIGLGVDGHEQPFGDLPALDDGNHLRWSFHPAVGFARSGYYLFRRDHIGDDIDPHRLSDNLTNFSAGTHQFPLTLSTEAGELQIDGPPAGTLTDDYQLGTDLTFDTGQDGLLELELDHDPLLIELPEPAFEVALLVDPTTPIEVTALDDVDSGTDRIPVDSATSADRGVLRLAFDRIDSIEVAGTGTLVDLRYKLVSDKYNEGWRPVPATDQPFTLPVEHPNYPASGGGLQDLDAARRLARNRIEYGSPTEYVDPGHTVQSGQATVSLGSPIVTTAGQWQPAVAGEMLQLDGDETAYMIVTRLDDARIILSRPYEGATRTDGYTISDDNFAHLHDALVTLVDDGVTAGGMAGRSVPQPIEDQGVTFYWPGYERVYGWGTNWSSDLEGLMFKPALTSAGTITAVTGSASVQRDAASVSEPTWDDDVVGGSLRFDGQHTAYTITGVNGARLELDRAYAGPTQSGLDFTILSPMGYEIERVDATDELVLKSPYRGEYTAMEYAVEAPFGSDALGGPTFPAQHPLDSVLLSTLSPAFSQALGLYWNDRTAAPDQSYDYLVVADHDGSVGRFYARGEAFDPLNAELFGSFEGGPLVDGYITFDVRGDRTEPLEAPTGASAYELPERPPTETATDRNVAGINWDHETSPGGRSLPGNPVYYHLLRHAHGQTEPATDPLDADAFDLITSPPGLDTERDPIMVSTSDEQPPDGWPDERVHAIDPGLSDGWYGYRVSGVDIFGRASKPSPPAAWLSIDGTIEHHPVAVELRDDTPPPPPRAVYAEHDDATSVSDVGNGEMTVSWIWTQAAATQAPDTESFHLYYHPGGFADQQGTTTQVTVDHDGIYTVETDIDPIDPPGSLTPGQGYAGATLHVGEHSYAVIDSRAINNGSQLELTVGDRRSDPPATLQTQDGPVEIEATDSRPNVVDAGDVASVPVADRTPQTNVDCTVTVPPTYQTGTVTVEDGRTEVLGHGTYWRSELEGQPFTTPDGNRYVVTSVDSESKLTLDRPYEITESGVSRRGSFAYAITHPVTRDANDPDVWQRPAKPTDWETSWATVDVSSGTMVDPSGIPVDDRQFPAENDPYTRFEVTVPVPAATDPDMDPFVPGEDTPVVYANVGVTAMDDDNNESRVAGPVQIARADTTPPPAPEPPTYENEIDWATPPDYQGKSQYTVRWRHPQESCRTHVYRAMDKTLFEVDWQRRRDGATQDVRTAAADKPLFPAYRRDDDTRRSQIVTALDDLHAAVASESDFDAVLEAYTSLDPDVKQVLAALPENKSAYQQITMEALSTDDDAAQNRAGPDLEPDETYPTSARWCAYVDSFDGRSRRQYFYRTGTIDAAGNRSDDWSDPTQPVQAVDTVPPRAPSIVGVTGGDREITISWASNQEADLATYRLLRATTEADAADVRSMTAIETVTETGAPASTASTDPVRPPTRSATDTTVDPGTTYQYRVVAIDNADNVSRPSKSIAGKAYVDSPPPEPTWTKSEWVKLDEDGVEHPWSATVSNATPAVVLSFRSAEPGVAALVQRETATGWQNLSGWQREPPHSNDEAHFTAYDETADTTVDQRYRAKLLNPAGYQLESDAVRTVVSPGGSP